MRCPWTLPTSIQAFAKSIAFPKDGEPYYALPQWKWIPSSYTPIAIIKNNFKPLIYLNLVSASSRETISSPNLPENLVHKSSGLSSIILILHRIFILGAKVLILMISSIVSAVVSRTPFLVAQERSFSVLTGFEYIILDGDTPWASTILIS